MKLLYKTHKWEIEKMCKRRVPLKQRLTQVEAQINDYLYPESITNKGTPPIEDRVSLYHHLAGTYEFIYEMQYMEKQVAESFQNMYLYAMSMLKAYALKSAGEKVTNPAVEAWMNTNQDVPAVIFALMSVNEMDLAREFSADREPVLHYFLTGDDEKIRKCVELLPKFSECPVDTYYGHSMYLKEIYQAILEKDEKKLNKALGNRIRTYRKNPADYSTIIDTCSIAMIKLAKRQGMQYRHHVIEIPEYYLNENLKIDPENCRLPEIPEKERSTP